MSAAMELPWCHPDKMANRPGAVVRSFESDRLVGLGSIPTTERRETAIRRIAERAK